MKILSLYKVAIGKQWCAVYDSLVFIVLPATVIFDNT